MITWQYIAGFFDGEGSVGLHQNHKYGCSPQIQLPQSDVVGQILLERIGEFLTKEDIAFRVYHPKASSPLARKQEHRLLITRRDAATKFLSKLLPFIEVKKLAVQDTLRHLKLFPALPRGGKLSWEGRC